ncbi:RHS repeat-associated core domain-containing protein [Pseudomonas sp. MWU13-2100]|uniref:RHS repeat-associated core domain-containing protein n=1 Tax=Pseudomonas sp. MWU13-2100 TaxID=2935075 RepID=UPI00200D873E|nr:RHS repeat-associated core domain-containing protein [Pseudomonas sp. MWU13-2100]
MNLNPIMAVFDAYVLSATPPDADKMLADFQANSLTHYKELADGFLTGWAMDIDQEIRVSDEVSTLSKKDANKSDRKIETYATCPVNGKLTLLHRFDSSTFVPIGNTPYLMEPVNTGSGTGESFKGRLDKLGMAQIQGCIPDQQYRLTFHPQVGQSELDALYGSYDGIVASLHDWLSQQWQGSIAPKWKTFAPVSDPKRLEQANQALRDGIKKALKSLWEDIKKAFSILANLDENMARLLTMINEADFKKLKAQADELLSTALTLLSDPLLMYLYTMALLTWVRMLPPTMVAEAIGEFSTDFLINFILGVVLSGGIGLVVRVTVSGGAAGIATGTRMFLQDAVQALIDVSTSHQLKPHAKTLVPLVTASESVVNSSAKTTKQITSAAQGIDKVAADTLDIPKAPNKKITVEESTPVDDASKQAKTRDDKPADACSATCTNGCPVSMVTGEELLTLTDGQLDGLLPFEWTRLYRTSAVETECGLGPGWSHALAQRVTIEGDTVTWLDHENRSTEFPLPSVKRPAITNSLSKAAIYLGDDPSELILTQAGDQARFYHFRFDRHSASLIAISDAYGNRLHLQRDILGRIMRVDNGAGRALLLRYDRSVIVGVDYQSHRPADTAEASWQTLQNLVTYRYDEQRRLVEATNAVGESELYAYDTRHVIQVRQLAGGAKFFWEWEGQGKSARCVHHWANFAQMDARYTWGDDGSVTVLNADGSQEVYVHDDNARLVKQVDPDGATHEKAYDEKGRLIAEKDPLGAVTEYQYNDAGRLVAVIPTQDAPTVYEYDNGFVSAVQRGKAEWKYDRNAQGDITRQTDPSGNTSAYTYDARGRLLDIRHADGSVHQLTWNPQGQLIEEQLPNGGQRRYRYDALGRQITRQDETGAVTQYQWNPVGRLTQVQLPGGATRAFTYNAYGKLTSERDELGRLTRYEYADNLHLVSRRLNPDGSQLKYRYDNARLLLTDIENERGEQYHLDYYGNGLIQQETGFDGRRTAYVYDLNGQLIEKTEFGDDGSELKTAYQRDTAGRLQVKTLSDGEKIHYHYDALGRLVNVDDGHWPLAYEYDLQDRLTTEHQGWATLHYRYDALGQLSHARLPDGSTLDYRHLAGGDLSAIDLNGQRLTSHQYSAGREQQRQQGQLLSQYQYDEQGRLTEHRVSQHQQRLLARTYDYDANGNLARISDSRKGMREYHYDPLDRLITVRGDLTEAFSHDPAGNLLSQAPERDGNRVNVQGNRLLMQGDAHYDYDAYGNLIRERRGAGQRLVTEYAYDCQHRLVEARLPNGQVAKYRYDAFGRRIEKTVEGKTTEFIWQGEQLIAEAAAGHYRSYVYEPGTFRPLAMLDGEGPGHALPYYYQLDHLGTPQELTSSAGAILWSARYKAYGNVAKLEVAEIDNPLRFQGQYFDAETRLHYNRHRYYNPGTGRFLTPDPIKLAGGLNNYRYVPNPTGWVDPLGLNGDCPGGAACKPPSGAEDPKNKAQVNQGEPAAPAPVTNSEKTIRVRHYTNRKGSTGIEQDGVISAQDNNRVYVEPANKKALNQLTAEEKYQIGRGRGRDYIETDVPESQLEWVKNPRYGTMELTIKGNLKLNNPTFTRRK